MRKTLTKVHTYKNTEFVTWWKMFNDACEERGVPKEDYDRFDIASGCYEVGETPETAADYLKNG